MIALNVEPDQKFGAERHVLFKELSVRPDYDVIFYTTAAVYDAEFLRPFLTAKGRLVSTVDEPLASDSFGSLGLFALRVSAGCVYAVSL